MNYFVSSMSYRVGTQMKKSRVVLAVNMVRYWVMGFLEQLMKVRAYIGSLTIM